MAGDTHSVRYRLADEAATDALGGALGATLLALRATIAAHGLALGLQGELGSGKTALVRAVLRHAGTTGTIKSPTFALLEPYEVSRLNFYHFDFYRFKSPQEFRLAGFGEYFGAGAVCFVEWPERAAGYLPPLDLRIVMRVAGQAHDAGRTAELSASTEIGKQCLERLIDTKPPDEP